MAGEIEELLARMDPVEIKTHIERLTADLEKVKRNRDIILKEKQSLKNRTTLEGPKGSTLTALVAQDGSVIIPKNCTPAEYQHFRKIAQERGVQWHVAQDRAPVSNDAPFPHRWETDDLIYIYQGVLTTPQVYQSEKTKAAATYKQLKIFASPNDLPKAALDAAKEASNA